MFKTASFDDRSVEFWLFQARAVEKPSNTRIINEKRREVLRVFQGLDCAEGKTFRGHKVIAYLLLMGLSISDINSKFGISIVK